MNIFIKKNHARKTQEENGSSFDEYDLPWKNLAVGISEVNGRYPKESGLDSDEGVEQVWYVQLGEGSIYIQDELIHIEQGDMLLVPKGEKYWIEGMHLKLVVSSSPPWYPEQHMHYN